jgi:hypothetical protein
MTWNAFVAAVRSAGTLVLDSLGMATCTKLARAVRHGVAIAGVLACASAHAVVYSGLSVAPPGGVVVPGGSLQVKFNYTVSATDWPGDCGDDAVKKVELRKAGAATALASISYIPATCADNNVEIVDAQRVGALTATLAVGSHDLYLRTYTKFNTSGANSSVTTVEVTNNVAPGVSVTSPVNGTTYTVLAGRTTYSVPIKASGTGSGGTWQPR